jgi:ATP-dependent Clp protease protease subunit
VRGGFEGQAADILIASQQILKLKNRIDEILVKHTGQPLKTIEKDTDRDFYLSAQEAKKYGVIDEVIKGKG